MLIGILRQLIEILNFIGINYYVRLQDNGALADRLRQQIANLSLSNG